MRDTLNISFTVGIPTYYGAPAIIDTVKSILRSVQAPPFRIIVTVDGNPLKPEIETGLRNLGAEVIFNKVRGGQTSRIKQLIALCQTDILILTQDDVLFTPTAVAEIVTLFSKEPSVTMIGANIKPITAENFFERIVEVGVRIRDVVGRRWLNGDNYLMSIGRCLAFRTDTAKRLVISDEIINSDAYLYFENKRVGGHFLPCETAVVFNKSPQHLKEHLKQSRRFHNSRNELSAYTDAQLPSGYAVPRRLVISSIIREFVSHPILTICYLAITIYSYLGHQKNAPKKRFWETDVSTKR